MQERKKAEADSSMLRAYTKGINKILEKSAKKASKALLAAKDYAAHASLENKHDLIYEVADLWFCSIVDVGLFRP